MQIAVLTFDGFNELDSFIAAGILNRMRPQGWKAFITCPSETVTSMNGVTIQAEKPLEFAAQADAVLIGSGKRRRPVGANPAGPDPSVDWRTMLGNAAVIEIRIVGGPARLHRPDHQALGDRGRRRGSGSTFLCRW